MAEFYKKEKLKEASYMFHLMNETKTTNTLIHEEPKLLKCEEYLNRYNKNTMLIPNERRVQDDSNQFQCMACPRVFQKRKNLKRHMQDIHESRKGFECKECTTMLGTKTNLRRHTKFIHQWRKDLMQLNFLYQLPKSFAVYDILRILCF